MSAPDLPSLIMGARALYFLSSDQNTAAGKDSALQVDRPRLSAVNSLSISPPGCFGAPWEKNAGSE